MNGRGIWMACHDARMQKFSHLGQFFDLTVGCGPQHNDLPHEIDIAEMKDQPDQAGNIIWMIARRLKALARSIEVRFNLVERDAGIAYAERHCHVL